MKKTYKLWEVLKALDKNPTLVFIRPETNDDFELIVKTDNHNIYNEKFYSISSQVWLELNYPVDKYEIFGDKENNNEG